MAEPVIITWNPQNWFTVFFMGALVMLAIGVTVKVLKQRQAMQAGQ